MPLERKRTFVLVVVDSSTSMLGVAAGIRDGVNSYLADLVADTRRDYLVSVTTFATGTRRLCSVVPVQAAPVLDEHNYRPDGNTALLDAIGSTLVNFGADVELGQHDQVLFVLATDGAENASLHHSPGDVLDMIADREADGRWTFIHLAAGVEAAAQGLTLGLRHVIAIAQADLAREALYQTMSDFTREWATGEVEVDWSQLRDLTRPRPGHAEQQLMEAALDQVPGGTR